MYNSTKSVIWKVVIIWFVFAFLHYAHAIFPNPVFAFLGEAAGRESVFGHLKMNFSTYIFRAMYISADYVPRVYNQNVSPVNVQRYDRMEF